MSAQPPHPVLASGDQWTWTGTECRTWEDVFAGEHVPEAELYERLKGVFRRGVDRQQLMARQPVVCTSADYNQVVVFDANPGDPGVSAISMVVQTRQVDIRHVGCLEEIEKVKDLVGRHKEAKSHETVAYIVGAILQIPVGNLEVLVDKVEEDVFALEGLVFSRKPRSGRGLQGRTARARQTLSTYQKLLGGYCRVCDVLVSHYVGAFKARELQEGGRLPQAGAAKDEAAEIREECQRYIVGLKTRIEGALAKVVQLKEALQAIVDYSEANQAAKNNRLMWWLSFVLLPAALVVGTFGMNFNMPGDIDGGTPGGMLTFFGSVLRADSHSAIGLLQEDGGFWPAVALMLAIIGASLCLYWLGRLVFVLFWVGQWGWEKTAKARETVRNKLRRKKPSAGPAETA